MRGITLDLPGTDKVSIEKESDDVSDEIFIEIVENFKKSSLKKEVGDVLDFMNYYNAREKSYYYQMEVLIKQMYAPQEGYSFDIYIYRHHEFYDSNVYQYNVEYMEGPKRLIPRSVYSEFIEDITERSSSMENIVKGYNYMLKMSKRKTILEKL